MVAHSLDDAIKNCPANCEAWVIGGADIYAQAMPLSDHAVVTEIDADFEGDAYAPTFDASWTEVNRSTHVSTNGLVYSFVSLERNFSRGEL